MNISILGLRAMLFGLAVMPKCRYCKSAFQSASSLDKFCGYKCAMAFLATPEGAEKHKKVKAKMQRERITAKKEALKTKGEWTRDLQRVFNEFIRLRDSEQPCISCGVSNGQLAEKWRGGKWDAGHYRSVGSAPHMRFDEANCHKQCKKCNNYDSGNHVEYRKGLIQRIGLEAVERIESEQKPLKLSIQDIKELLKHYRAEVRRLKREESK